jgi:hypothetical protein
MYWADLSRLGQGVFRIFGELYQLLLHVPNLGRHAVVAAGIEDGAKIPAWCRLIEQQRWAAYFLTVVIPLLNLWLLACVFVGLSGPLVVEKLPQSARPLPALAIVGLVALVGLATRLSSREPPLGYVAWATAPLLIVAAVVGGYAAIRYWNVWSISFAFTALLALAGVFALGWRIVTRYANTNPDARIFGRVSLVIVAIALAVEIVRTRAADQNSIMTAAFHVGEFALLAASIAWIGAFLLQLNALVTGRLALRRARRDVTEATTPESKTWQQQRYDRLSRAEHTARLTFAIPAVSFIIVTMVLSAGLYQVLYRLVKTTGYGPVLVQLLLPEAEHAKLQFHSEVAWQMIALSTPELIVLLVLTGLAMLLALWGLLPVVISELRVPGNDVNPRSLGRWLDRAFQLLRYAGFVMILASAIVVPTVLAQTIYRYEPAAAAIRGALERVGVSATLLNDINGTMSSQSENALKFLGTIVAGTAMGLFAFGGRLKTLSGGVRPVLDVLLDVDNYLREHPKTNNPRARIFARYIALLRHLCQWKDPDGRGYSRIVIIAHSQGSVISADLLRFLKCRNEDSLDPLGKTIKLYLFTMGSPLRQLYGLRFPHFYRWARHLDPALKGHGPDLIMADAVIASPLVDDQLPTPDDCRVERWVNVYRSCDYVGRHLWRPDRSLFGRADDVKRPPPTPPDRRNISQDKDGFRREFCIGAGAHLHYWDPETRQVADALDELIDA